VRDHRLLVGRHGNIDEPLVRELTEDSLRLGSGLRPLLGSDL
jgi:hypothetical protein